MKNDQIIRWCVDVAMGITFLVSFITGLIKFAVLMRIGGIGQIVLPLAGISDIHDKAGVLLGLFVVIHLYLNRHWILTMTRKILTGKKTDE
jgi:hypothetical protein